MNFNEFSTLFLSAFRHFGNNEIFWKKFREPRKYKIAFCDSRRDVSEVYDFPKMWIGIVPYHMLVSEPLRPFFDSIHINILHSFQVDNP